MIGSSIAILYDLSGNPLATNDGSAPAGTAGIMASGFDGTNSRRLLVDAGGRLVFGDTVARSIFQQISDGTTGPVAVKAASVAAVATDLALVVAVSPNNTPVLPSGAATSVNQTNGAQKSQTVDGSGNVQPAGDSAARPVAQRLSDGAAFYDTAKTGQLPAALVGGRLDENTGSWMGSTAPTVGQKAAASSLPITIATEHTGSDNSANSTNKVATLGSRANAAAPAWTEGNQAPLSSDLLGNLRAKLSGVPSALAANSTATPLGANAVFTGTWEDVSDYAAIQFIAFADQASAANGFSIQWSPNGTNADVTDPTNLSAGVGRGFSLTPRGRFFRIVYTNGAVAQGAFRLLTVYHVNGVGLITRLLSAVITEDNFAQNVRAFLAGKDAAGNFQNLTATPNKSLAVTPGGGRSIVGKYGAATGLVAGTAGAQNIASIENPAASGKTVYIKRVQVGATSTAAAAVNFQYLLGRTTATPTAGTTLTAQKRATSDTAPVAIVRSGPTATAATGTLWAGAGPVLPNNSSITPRPIDAWKSDRDDEDIVLAAGEGLLLSAGANDTDLEHTISFMWEEV